MSEKPGDDMDTEYDPYPKRKNEDRIGFFKRLYYFWTTWWGAIVIIVFLAMFILWAVSEISSTNDRRNNQSQYTDNATDITATCMQQTAYAGELLDCLYAKGFTLVYHERPVARVDEP